MVDWERINALVRAGKYDEMTPEEEKAFLDDIKIGAYNQRDQAGKKRQINLHMVVFAYDNDWENLGTNQKFDALEKNNQWSGENLSVKEMYVLMEEIDKVIETHTEGDRVEFRRIFGPKK